MFQLSEVLNDNECKILLLVLDGLGGYADATHDSELEQARTPNLDRLAAEGSVGLLDPLMPGVTVGSGPGTPRPVRVRPSGVRTRPWRAVGHGRGVRPAPR